MSRTGWAFGLVVALGLMASPLFADDSTRANAREAWLERIKGELALSEQQVKEIRTILEAEKPAEVTGEERRQRSKEAIEKIDAVLTSEQRTHWAQMREKRRRAKGAEAAPETSPAPAPTP